ncbi:MAG TPA: hypothetical protein VGH90_11150 [Chthoniobacteraceae bacterium]
MNQIWITLGALAAYYLVMRMNPIRLSLRDGLRVLRRYPTLWLTLGLFGFGYSLFLLGLRYYFSRALPAGAAPVFFWTRSAYHADWSWFFGKSDSLWCLPAGAANAALPAVLLPVLDSSAGLFNDLVSTFPFSALAALALLFNLRGRQGVLFRALRKRFGIWGWPAHLAILLCAIAAAAKPALFILLGRFPQPWFVQWAQVAQWLAFLFEYLFGIYIQVYLILLAYCWVRGLTFERHHLVNFAIRRSSFVLRWAAVVMLLSSLCIDLPLILRYFPPFAGWVASMPEKVVHWLLIARISFYAILLCFATVQITLVFHSESLRQAMGDHFRFVRRNGWTMAWFLFIAAIHFFLLHAVDFLCEVGFGEGAALWVAWKLFFPWLSGVIGGWLLASWVCVFRRCDTGRAQSENWIQF